jgi:hypothetical protein
MFWMKQRIVETSTGKEGVAVLIADRSRSMPSSALTQTEQVLPNFLASIPNLKVFAFHYNYVEVDCSRSEAQALARARVSGGNSKSGPEYVNCTYLGHCLEKVARLKPKKTIVISDGGVADADRALAAADRITGNIDAYFCPSAWQNRYFMEQLARRGRGRFVQVDTYRSNIYTDLRQSFKILLGPVFTEVWREPEWLAPEGGPSQGRVGVAGAKVSVASKFTRG